MKLRQKAHYAFAQYKAGLWIPPSHGTNFQDDDDAPGIITGTKVMAAKGAETSTTTGTPSWRGSQSPPSSLQSPQSLHPRLEEYLHSVLQPGPLDNTSHLLTSQLDSGILFQAPGPSLYPHMPWHSSQMQLSDSTPILSNLPSANFVEDLAPGFVPFPDSSKVQTLNEEWARFMSEI